MQSKAVVAIFLCVFLSACSKNQRRNSITGARNNGVQQGVTAPTGGEVIADGVTAATGDASELRAQIASQTATIAGLQRDLEVARRAGRAVEVDRLDSEVNASSAALEQLRIRLAAALGCDVAELTTANECPATAVDASASDLNVKIQQFIQEWQRIDTVASTEDDIVTLVELTADVDADMSICSAATKAMAKNSKIKIKRDKLIELINKLRDIVGAEEMANAGLIGAITSEDFGGQDYAAENKMLRLIKMAGSTAYANIATNNSAGEKGEGALQRLNADIVSNETMLVVSNLLNLYVVNRAQFLALVELEEGAASALTVRASSGDNDKEIAADKAILQVVINPKDLASKDCSVRADEAGAGARASVIVDQQGRNDVFGPIATQFRTNIEAFLTDAVLSAINLPATTLPYQREFDSATISFTFKKDAAVNVRSNLVIQNDYLSSIASNNESVEGNRKVVAEQNVMNKFSLYAPALSGASAKISMAIGTDIATMARESTQSLDGSVVYKNFKKEKTGVANAEWAKITDLNGARNDLTKWDAAIEYINSLVTN